MIASSCASVLLIEVSEAPLTPLHDIYTDGRSNAEMVELRRRVIESSARELMPSSQAALLKFLRQHRTDFVGDGSRIYTLLGGHVAEVKA